MPPSLLNAAGLPVWMCQINPGQPFFLFCFWLAGWLAGPVTAQQSRPTCDHASLTSKSRVSRGGQHWQPTCPKSVQDISPGGGEATLDPPAVRSIRGDGCLPALREPSAACPSLTPDLPPAVRAIREDSASRLPAWTRVCLSASSSGVSFLESPSVSGAAARLSSSIVRICSMAAVVAWPDGST